MIALFLRENVESESQKAAEQAEQEDAADTSARQDAEEVDIDLNDPEVAEAAAKIQAGFKGYKARQEVAVMKVSSQEVMTPL